MKTWKQLEAMAKRQGLRVQHDSHTWFVSNEAADNVALGEWWASGPAKTGRILRAMCEAALREMERRP